MLPHISLPHALLRGRYMAAAARMEHNGIPVDVELLDRLREHWDTIKTGLIEAVDVDYGVFENGAFKLDRFSAWLAGQQHPVADVGVGPARSRRRHLQVDGQHLPRSFAAPRAAGGAVEVAIEQALGGQGRAQPLPIVGAPRSHRAQSTQLGEIPVRPIDVDTRIDHSPPEGHAVAYVDWSQQEFGIAAAMSGDEAMMSRVPLRRSLPRFGKAAGFIPPDADKSHPMREMAKQCVLGVGYGMGEQALAASRRCTDMRGPRAAPTPPRDLPRLLEVDQCSG